MSIKKISTKDMSHEDWLRERKKGIGGSDVACILGLNKYKSAFALYHEKKSETIDDYDNEAMRIGRDLEAYVAARFMEKSGIKIKRENNILINDNYPYIRANVDRLCMGQKAGLECKTASTWNAKSFGVGEFPAHYYAQCVAYMAVTELPVWYLAVLVMGKEFKVYCLSRDKDMACPEWCDSICYVSDEEIGAVTSACAEFWDNFEKGVEPSQFNANDDEAINARFSPDKSREIDVTAIADNLKKICELKEEIEDLTALKKQLEQEVKMFMQDNGKGTANGYYVTFSTSTRTSYDMKKLQSENENLDLTPYQKTTNVATLRIKKAED